MTASRFEIIAPSRLHFGLFSLGADDRARDPAFDPPRRRFGGVGMMIDQPELRLRIEPADRFIAVGPLAERVLEFAERWTAFHRLPDKPPFQLRVIHAPPQHAGLGVGTQLGLSVAAALTIATGQPMPNPAELAISVGRGLRSAVGTYGFAEGGMIIEKGKRPGEPIAPLDTRLDLPGDWRIVLLRPRGASGLCGRAEQAAFADLPPQSLAATAELIAEVRERLVPAAALGDFAVFSDSVQRVGRLAGSAFAAIQGGPYNGPRLTELVAAVQAVGVRGVGQSSWGPTLFAFLPNAEAAERFVQQFRHMPVAHDLELTITTINCCGVRVEKRSIFESSPF